MAQAVRRAVGGLRPPRHWLAVLPVLLILAPLLPGLMRALRPAFDGAVWQALWHDTQWPHALRATLVSSVLSTLLACGMAAVPATPGQALEVPPKVAV